jgi:probable F420-dependent oxidoreductase
VKVYAGMDPRLALADVAPYARRVESLGYDALHVAETVHDSMAVALVALEHTHHLTVRTSVTLALVRSPTLTAYAAWDLAKFSGGRFQLGLGTQIRQNIEDRYGMPWDDPLGRMRDYVQALRDLFAAFAGGEAPHHDGAYYRLTRLQPYFNPGPDPETIPPPVWLGGVNAGACRLAGELADGFVTHPTNSNVRYLETICRPRLAEGARHAGRPLDEVELAIGTPVITGPDRLALEAERERQRRLFGFLYSTPAYRRTLELYGWEDLAGRLQEMVRHDRWEQLGDLVTDDVLDAVAPVALYDELPALVRERFGSLGQGILLSPPSRASWDDAFTQVIKGIQAP